MRTHGSRSASVGMIPGCPLRLSEDVFLLFGGFLGDIHHYIDQLVAAAAVLVVGNTLAAETEHLARLCACRDVEASATADGGHFHAAAATAVGMSSMRLYITSAPSRISSGCGISSTTTRRSPGTPPPLG